MLEEERSEQTPVNELLKAYETHARYTVTARVARLSIDPPSRTDTNCLATGSQVITSEVEDRFTGEER